MKERVNDALELLGHLERIPEFSPFRFLGLMSTIELMATHPPKTTDFTDSIGRQVRQKMRLVGNRSLKIPIPYDLFDFGKDIDGKALGRNVLAGKAWPELYELRSMIAHGSRPDFVKSLKPINSVANAVTFLDFTVRALLRLTLDDEFLLDDLKEC